MLPDYYSILGVSPTSSFLVIKAAYRSLAKEHHPDRHGGDPEKNNILKEINEAYSVLSHSDTKLAYDKQLLWQAEYAAAQRNRTTPPPPAAAYRPPPQPYQYAPRSRPYTSTQYVYSKWTLMYGKIFVIGLILCVVLFPIMLEYYFSNYYYNKGIDALNNREYYEAEGYFLYAMRELGGSNTLAAIKAAEMKIAENSNIEALNFIKLGLGYAVKSADRARLYYLKGIVERNLRRKDDAEASLKTALYWHYNHDSVYAVLAPLYAYQLKNYPKAIASYDTLMKNNAFTYDNYLNRGFCLQKLGKHEAALDDFNYFMKNKGVNGSVLFLKAISQVGLEQLDSACFNFNEAKMAGIGESDTFIKLYCQENKTKDSVPFN